MIRWRIALLVSAAIVLSYLDRLTLLAKTVFGRMVERDYEPHFHLELMSKDLTYACSEGEQVKLNLRTAAAALELFNQAKAGGCAGKDFSSVVEQLRTS